MFPTDRATRILAQSKLAEAHLDRVEQQETTDQGLTAVEQELNRLGRLHATDHAGQHTQDASLGAIRHRPGGRRLGVEAAIAGTLAGPEDRGLPLESEDTAVDVRFSQQDASVVDQVARGKIVGAVDHHIVRGEDLQRVLGRESHGMGFDLDVRVDRQ